MEMFKFLKVFILVLCVTFISSSVYGGEFRDVKNEAVSDAFNLTHAVARDSYFKTIVATSYIDRAGTTKLGRFFIRNNTRDGFKLTIDSLELGVLKPTGESLNMLDGEVPIPYSVTISKEGDIGEGIDASFVHNSAALINQVTVLNKAGDVVSSPTDAEFAVLVNIVDDSNIMEMAGTYTDTLTFTYTDL
jgi:hypothetical protein